MKAHAEKATVMQNDSRIIMEVVSEAKDCITAMYKIALRARYFEYIAEGFLGPAVFSRSDQTCVERGVIGERPRLADNFGRCRCESLIV
jgi:hypothetical protein